MATPAKKKSIDVILIEIFKQYIQIKDSDYKMAQTVFNSVFEQVKQKMSDKDNFFKRYSSQVINAGSVYDGIKVGKLDEFDLDIVIRLPINYEEGDNGITIENHKPGFVKLKILKGFDNLDKQPDWEKCHKVTRDWRDDDKYFLQNKFRHWMHSIVQKAVNDLEGRVVVGDARYQLSYKESGPAYTLNIRHEPGQQPFALDVDLVPVVRFLLPRWPEGYRSVEGSAIKEWLVVPKPIKSLDDKKLKNRCWRLAFHDFERELIKGCELLKLVIRLLKKLRDSLGLNEIASYYIKTLFLWEIDERQDKKYWQNKVSVLFSDMVHKFHKAIESKTIKYYWHEGHNLIEGLRPSLQKVYADKLKEFIVRLNAGDVDSVVTYLLTQEECAEFKNSEFYRSFSPTTVVDTSLSLTVSRQESTKSSSSGISSVDGPKNTRSDDETDLLKEILAANKRLESKLDSLTKRIENKVDLLSKNVDNLYRAIEDIKGEKKDVLENFNGVSKDLNQLTEDLRGLDMDSSSWEMSQPCSGEMVCNIMSNVDLLSVTAAAPNTESDLLLL